MAVVVVVVVAAEVNPIDLRNFQPCPACSARLAPSACADPGPGAWQPGLAGPETVSARLLESSQAGGGLEVDPET